MHSLICFKILYFQFPVWKFVLIIPKKRNQARCSGSDIPFYLHELKNQSYTFWPTRVSPLAFKIGPFTNDTLFLNPFFLGLGRGGLQLQCKHVRAWIVIMTSKICAILAASETDLWTNQWKNQWMHWRIGHLKPWISMRWNKICCGLENIYF